MELLKATRLFTDGAMGTMLQGFGLAPGASPDAWNIEHPEQVAAVHGAYLTAGSNMVLTNTFGTNRLRQKKGNHAVADLASAAVAIARRAVDAVSDGTPRFVALDVGPLGEFLEPLGDLTVEEAEEIFSEPISAAAKDSDCILIETMCDVSEACAAVRAAKKYGAGKPVFCTLSFDGRGRLMTGADIPTAFAALADCGADAVGCNCGVGPEQLLPLLPTLCNATRLPLLMKPNAGLPVYRDGKTVYDVTPDEFALDMRKLMEGGVWALGGCCGTTPAHIAAMVKACGE